MATNKRNTYLDPGVFWSATTPAQPSSHVVQRSAAAVPGPGPCEGSSD